MKVLNPENTNHEIVFIPRYYPGGDVVLSLINETTKEESEYTVTPLITDGLMYLNFEETFHNNSRFHITVKESENIVFRGILFVTDQSEDTQNYKISKGIFTYE